MSGRKALIAGWSLVGLALGPGLSYGQAASSEDAGLSVVEHAISKRPPALLFLSFASLTPIDGAGDAEVFGAFSDVMETHTGLALQRAPDDWVECLERQRRSTFFLCLDSKIDGDEGVPPVAIYLSVAPAREGRGAQLAVTVFQPEAARAALEELDASTAGSPTAEEREERITLLTQREAQDGLMGKRAIRDFGRSLVTGTMKRFFASHPPLGKIEVRLPEPGILYWQDRQEGLPMDTLTRLVEVPLGAHRIRFEVPRYERAEMLVDVSSDETEVVEPQLVRAPQTLGVVLNQSVFWGGMATAAAGAALLTVSLTSSKQGVVCVFPTEPGCSSGFGNAPTSRQRLGVEDSQDSFADESIDRTGVITAPLGYSLMATGVIWTVGTWLQNEVGDEIPWLPFVTGLVVGGASLGVSLAVDSARTQ